MAWARVLAAVGAHGGLRATPLSSAPTSPTLMIARALVVRRSID